MESYIIDNTPLSKLTTDPRSSITHPVFGKSYNISMRQIGFMELIYKEATEAKLQGCMSVTQEPKSQDKRISFKYDYFVSKHRDRVLVRYTEKPDGYKATVTSTLYTIRAARELYASKQRCGWIKK